MQEREKIPDTCPHCGRPLSPWEQVLLSVDRAIMCKGCWYRIILDAFEDRLSEAPPSPPEERS
jgi:DNA-directed RNA polymerase subunit RPC12/RpoP